MLLVVGLVLVSEQNSRADRLLEHGARAPGEVVGRGSRSRDAGYIKVRWRPVGDGERVTQINLTGHPRHYRIGQPVVVVYDSDDPSHVRTDAEENPSGWSTLLFVTLVVTGVSLLMAGPILLRRAARLRRGDPPNWTAMPLLRPRIRRP